MKVALLVLLALLICFPLAAQPAGPGLNTVDKFGSTARENKKFGYTHHENHHNYMSWIKPGSITSINPNGMSCCGNKDCDIVRTFFDQDTQEHYIMYDGKELILSKEFRVRELDGTYKKSPDGNSHACIAEWQLGSPVVLCWVLGDSLN